MNKIVKQAKAGALWNGKGYLTIGLERYDVKIIHNQDANKQNSPKYKLVHVAGLKERFLCSLFESNTNNGKAFLNGTIEVGFGQMEIKIFPIDESKRKDKEKSPTSIIFGRLLMMDIDKKEETEQNYDVVDIPEEEIPL